MEVTVRYVMFIAIVIAGFAFVPLILDPPHSEMPARGMAMLLAGGIGRGLAAVAVGCIGLLWRPNQFIGLVILTLFAIIAMMVGS